MPIKAIKRLNRSRARLMSKEEYDEIERRSNTARFLLEDPQFAFIRDYIKQSTDSIEETVISNRITDVTEEVTISERVKKLFFTPKKVQIDELSGQYKWITKFLADLEFWSEEITELDDQVAKGTVEIE